MATIHWVQTILNWPSRRWVVAIVGSVASFLFMALPADIIANPVFGRDVAVTSWAIPVAVVTSVLSGMLMATYVKSPDLSPDQLPARMGSVGGLLAFFAVGCPVCNKLALLALGYSGALHYFAPIQPYLAGLGMALLAYALIQRVRNEYACRMPG